LAIISRLEGSGSTRSSHNSAADTAPAAPP
jgi:hypothetical protein